jgi:hypothetical protein
MRISENMKKPPSFARVAVSVNPAVRQFIVHVFVYACSKEPFLDDKLPFIFERCLQPLTSEQHMNTLSTKKIRERPNELSTFQHTLTTTIIDIDIYLVLGHCWSCL